MAKRDLWWTVSYAVVGLLSVAALILAIISLTVLNAHKQPCVYSNWGAWNPQCLVPAAGGAAYQVRSRTGVSRAGSGNGATCPVLTETGPCLCANNCTQTSTNRTLSDTCIYDAFGSSCALVDRIDNRTLVCTTNVSNVRGPACSSAIVASEVACTADCPDFGALAQGFYYCEPSYGAWSIWTPLCFPTASGPQQSRTRVSDLPFGVCAPETEYAACACDKNCTRVTSGAYDFNISCTYDPLTYQCTVGTYETLGGSFCQTTDPLRLGPLCIEDGNSTNTGTIIAVAPACDAFCPPLTTPAPGETLATFCNNTYGTPTNWSSVCFFLNNASLVQTRTSTSLRNATLCPPLVEVSACSCANNCSTVAASIPAPTACNYDVTGLCFSSFQSGEAGTYCQTNSISSPYGPQCTLGFYATTLLFYPDCETLCPAVSASPTPTPTPTPTPIPTPVPTPVPTPIPTPVPFVCAYGEWSAYTTYCYAAGNNTQKRSRVRDVATPNVLCPLLIEEAPCDCAECQRITTITTRVSCVDQEGPDGFVCTAKRIASGVELCTTNNTDPTTGFLCSLSYNVIEFLPACTVELCPNLGFNSYTSDTYNQTFALAPPPDSCGPQAVLNASGLCTACPVPLDPNATRYVVRNNVCVLVNICDDGDLCTNDAYDPLLGYCRSTPKADFGLQSDNTTFISCDPLSGSIVYTFGIVPDFSALGSCDDGNPATIDSFIAEGDYCRYTAISRYCTDSFQCAPGAESCVRNQCTSLLPATSCPLVAPSAPVDYPRGTSLQSLFAVAPVANLPVRTSTGRYFYSQKCAPTDACNFQVCTTISPSNGVQPCAVANLNYCERPVCDSAGNPRYRRDDSVCRNIPVRYGYCDPIACRHSRNGCVICPASPMLGACTCCNTNTDCDFGFDCFFGQCTKPCPAIGPAGCPLGESCFDGHCLTACNNGTGCEPTLERCDSEIKCVLR